ncbi:hypothetical protein KGA66_12170 [Actinocrinis puniceicyclus]|uniref:HTTM-like domain-containing protein n=1 Tax=Actinocrinis puniceicyclus TaxID=977794 RepID=A0A8J7WPU6_9ACTN|nr:sporulation-delaying protein SdpB family protein [Actinocrinis puniceicyclus]MBS2963809.1 hypothetical protein [Actinocrinis puniceicyclus]
MTWRLSGIESFEMRDAMLSLARSILALAQLLTILATPDWQMFMSVPSTSLAAQCTGIKAASLWCVTGGEQLPDPAGRTIATVVLLLVLSGYRPRWSCIPHWYVAFSIAEDVTTIDGGDHVAEIFTMLLIPICLGDERVWIWRKPVYPVAPTWRGAAFAGYYLIRFQAAFIYLSAALSKLAHPAWRHATALRSLLDNPSYGAPALLRPLAEKVLSAPILAAPLTWGVIAIELSIAASTALPRRQRRVGLLLVILLHGAIILLMGLFSFGLIMIALMMAVNAGTSAVAMAPTYSPTHERAEGIASR